MRDIVIDSIKIGRQHPPFVVAEMSGNHNQSLQRALQLVEAAAYAGVNAVKLQTYTADTITLDVQSDDFMINDAKSLWRGATLHALYQQSYTPWAWHKQIMEKCKQHGLLCFSTPFDETAVDFLESLNVPCYKIASFEVVHLPLIKKVASTGKPLIISTGLANVAELYEAVAVAHSAGCRDIVLLKCTSTYPAEPVDSNLITIPHMQTLFDCHVGLSDHTLGLGVSVASIALGATFIEKHFTLCRADGGADAEFSLEPEEMKNLVIEISRAWQALGNVAYGPTLHEKKSLQFRRSIYASRDIMAGEILSAENLKIIRPGYGLAPKYLEVIVGRKALRDITKGTPVDWQMFV
ncbi:MAG: pseudaminic acid synthase [Candidatus Babeliales bacterium]|jgi:N-acetylneuraminate synthase